MSTRSVILGFITILALATPGLAQPPVPPLDPPVGNGPQGGFFNIGDCTVVDGTAEITSLTDTDVEGTLAGDLEGAFANLRAAVRYLQGLPQVSGERLASVGWCFGGGWSYQMAKNDLGVRASVMYYGRFSVADDLSRMRALILGNFGEEDRSISVDSVREFQATLRTLSGAHEVYIYPNAGHAFANEDSASYNREAAELAWRRTLAFLEKHLH